MDTTPCVKIEILCRDELVEEVVSAIGESAHTGLRGDGKIYVTPVEPLCVSVQENAERPWCRGIGAAFAHEPDRT
jgi:nitrogen regulatory protein PII